MSSWISAKIVHIRTETNWVKTITLELLGKSEINFEPGDAIMVQAQSGLKRLIGYYSLSKVNGNQIEITLKRQDRSEIQGFKKLSFNRFLNINYFLHFSKPGKFIQVKKLTHPASGYYFDSSQLDLNNPNENLIFISGGLGVTLNMAILRQLVRDQWDQRKSIIFIYSIRTEQDFVFKDELIALEASHPKIKLVVHKTREGSPQSRINLYHYLQTHFSQDQIQSSKYFICGSREFSRDISQTLIHLGTTPGFIKSVGN